MPFDGHDLGLDTERLGAPVSPSGWQHGRAGRSEENLRIDCWLHCVDDVITEARFEVFGGPPALRAAAWLSEWLTGRGVTQAAALSGLAIAEAAALPVVARGDALCIEDALRAALAAPRIEGGA